MVLKIAYLNWWKRENINPQDNWLFNFIKVNITTDIIEVNYSENPDLLLCSCFGDIKNIIIHPCANKIFFYGENLARFKQYNNMPKLQHIFSLIIGFNDTNIKNKQIHLPLWITYYNYYNLGNINNDNDNNIISYLDSEFNKNKNKAITNNNTKNNDNTKHNDNTKNNKNIIYDKNAILIARHDRNGLRGKIYKALVNIDICVDCPGKFLNNTNKNKLKQLGRGNKAKKEYLVNYKYNICPENSKAINYFTEKIFHSLEAGCLPIYWAINKPETAILRDDVYLFITYNSLTDNNLELELTKENIEYKYNLMINSNTIFKETAYDEIKKIYTDLLNELTKIVINVNNKLI